MSKDKIIIKGAREHNLKNIDLELPRNKFIVFTGPSGSGKSSLAFDTIYAEGQRRYVESLSSYARQFLGQMEKPDMDFIEGLSPAISIDQKSVNHNPRSTVGTVTEIYDYLRLLYARVGIPHCYKCGREIKSQTVDQIVDSIMSIRTGAKLLLLAPVVLARKGEHLKTLADIRKRGYVRIRVNGIVHDISEDDNLKLDRNKKHTIEIVVDRLILKTEIIKRLTDSVESALKLGSGILSVDVDDGSFMSTFSQNFSCPDCGVSMDKLEPRAFSFNNPFGACEDCGGLGVNLKFDEDLIAPNPNLSILQGAIVVNGFNSIGVKGSMTNALFCALANKYDFKLDTPYKSLSKEARDIILNGTNDDIIKVDYISSNGEKKTYPFNFEGILNNLLRRYNETNSVVSRQDMEAYMTNVLCHSCHGKRLKKEILAVTINDKNIANLTDFPLLELLHFFNNLTFSEGQRMIADKILEEIKSRLGFLINVGLDYLTLSRSAMTLSGGESQRIRLATQIGSGLVGVVYILDEPSIGLHQRDNDKLLLSLRKLTDIGNTLIVVEHDTDTMLQSDYIVDIGPYAGTHGGEIIFSGPIDDLLIHDKSMTADYLTGRKKIQRQTPIKKPSDKYIVIKGACENNLKDITVSIPISLFTCITGVSGSGKSSLINQILYKRLARDLNRAKLKPGMHKDIQGIEYLDKIINIDQSPIGRTPRSNPATYVGLFDLIREIYASTNEARIKGYTKGRFSFNVKGGRCESCNGDGMIKIEMHFLPDIHVPCEVCKGRRYNRETLQIFYKGKNIHDVLDMTIEEAYEFFNNIPKLKDKLQALMDVGLSYIKLGQSSTTLSGGEAQRVKLASELSKKNTGKTVYVLDEPTTGLHSYDVHKLVFILEKLTENGNTVIVIEHNLDVIKSADYIIDLGPEGGKGGGSLVAFGTPSDIVECGESYTGKYLRGIL